MSWKEFLREPVDYSRVFEEKVGRLGENISKKIGVEVRQDSDMNYRAGQMLEFYVSATGIPSESRDAAKYLMRIAVSSKGPLWAPLVSQFIDSSNSLTPVSYLGVPVFVQLLASLGEILDAAGVRRVPDQDLGQLVPGYETDLDGAPATVQEVFFCEIC